MKKNKGSKGQIPFENYRFLSKEIDRNGRNGLLLSSDMQSFIRKPHFQVLAFPSDKKEKDKYKRWIHLMRFVTAHMTILLLKEDNKIWQFFVCAISTNYTEIYEQLHVVFILWVLTVRFFLHLLFLAFWTLKNLEYNHANKLCLLSKRIIFQCPYFNVACVMKVPLDLCNLFLRVFQMDFRS